MSKVERTDKSIKDQLVDMGLDPKSTEYNGIVDAVGKVYSGALQASNSSLSEIRTDLAIKEVVIFLRFMGYPVLEPNIEH